MVSVSTCFNYNLTLKEQIKMIKEAGFKSLSISGNYSHNGLLDNTDGLIDELLSSEISVDTIHGCRADDEEVLEILDKCCYVAERVGAHIVVVHPCDFYISKDKIDEKYERLLSLSDELIKMAQKYRITFALENLHPDSATDVLTKALDVLDHNYFGLCYDITHAQVDGPRDCKLLESYGHRIIAVHISDRIKAFVDHVVPGEGFIEFEPLIKKLTDIKYDGTILMEVLSDFTQYTQPKILLEKTYEAGKKIEDQIRKDTQSNV